MLIDASHRKKQRVVVLDGKGRGLRFAAASRRRLKELYLREGQRVEPSIQAAFVGICGNARLPPFLGNNPDIIKSPSPPHGDHGRAERSA